MQLPVVVVTLAMVILTACSSAPQPPKAPPKVDATQEPWYGESTQQLASMNRQAQTLLSHSKTEEAAAIITAAEPWARRVLSVPRPTLSAMAAASDLDELYGHMLLTNGNYGWARMMFQKNVARWRSWKPRTDETERRLKVAEAEVAECDRRMAE